MKCSGADEPVGGAKIAREMRNFVRRIFDKLGRRKEMQHDELELIVVHCSRGRREGGTQRDCLSLFLGLGFKKRARFVCDGFRLENVHLKLF